MRTNLFTLVIVFAGVSFAQDTNFTQGPQYLVPGGASLLLQPISTPTMSFSSSMPDAYASPTELAPSLISSAMSSHTTDLYLSQVAWGAHSSSEMLEHRVTTPSATVEQTQGLPVVVPEAASSVIEITSAETPSNLPASLLDPGVTAIGNAQLASKRGYGVSLGEVAARMKGSKHPGRVFTNEDLERLHNQ